MALSIGGAAKDYDRNRRMGPGSSMRIHSLGVTQGHDWEGHSNPLEVVEKRTFLVTRRSRIVRRLCHLLGKLYISMSCCHNVCDSVRCTSKFPVLPPSLILRANTGGMYPNTGGLYPYKFQTACPPARLVIVNS